MVPALAQDNMDKLTNMQKTDATFTFVDQDGDRAAALRDIIQHINVPEGFEVSLYAVVPDARIGREKLRRGEATVVVPGVMIGR